MSIDLNSVKLPQALTALRNWVCWRLEQDKKSSRDVKVPYNPATTGKASIADSSTWAILEVTLESQAKYFYSGIGVIITAESGFHATQRMDGKLTLPDAVKLLKMGS